MNKFMMALAAMTICSPFAAQASAVPAPTPVASVAISDAAYQSAHLDGQVMALNRDVQALEQQGAPGTAYVAELSGVIPTGG